MRHKSSLPKKQSGGLCHYSPDGKHIAIAVNNRLHIRDAELFHVVNTFSCLDSIELIEWSSDSRLVLCMVPKKSMVQVWAVESPDWSCRLSEGVAGVVYACWHPNSTHIITVADFQLHTTVWSLADQQQFPIKHTKLTSGGIAFSNNGEFMALAHRSDCKDFVGIYACREGYKRIKYFQVDSLDLEEIVWSPNGSTIVVRDTPLEYNVLVYDLNGNLVTLYQAYENALGVKAMAFSPSGEYLAIGSFDETVRVLNPVTWKPFTEFHHRATIVQRHPCNQGTGDAPPPEPRTVLCREQLSGDAALVQEAQESVKQRSQENKPPRSQENKPPRSHENKPPRSHENSAALGNRTKSAYGKTAGRAAKMAQPLAGSASAEETEMQSISLSRTAGSKTVTVQVVKPDPTKPSPRIGVSLMVWSSDESFLATRNDNMPFAVWIWTMRSREPAVVLELRGKVLSMKWEPNSQRLAIVTGNSKLYWWTPTRGVEMVSLSGEQVTNPVPTSWDAKGIRWRPSGGALTVLSKASFVQVVSTCE